MASVKSPIRSIVKPLFFKLLGKRGYFRMQVYAKAKDIRQRLVEEKEMELLPRLVQKGDEVLDIGANFAYYSTRLSENVGPDGTVIAFEPIPFTHRVCEALLKVFKASNVQLHNKGVGAKNEQVKFSVPLQDFGALSAGQAHFAGRNNELEGKEKYYQFNKAETFMCDVVSLDSFLGGKLSKLSFVKIDIEGAEYHALKGMSELLTNHQPVILIEIQPFFLKGFGIEEADLLQLIEELGYELYLYDQASKKLNNSMEAYQRLVKVYEKKDQGCQTSLKICRTRAPVISKQVSHLLKLNEGQQKQHSDCLAAKTGLAANLTSCHSELVVAHERVHNATVNKNLLETHNRVGKIKTAACLNDKELLDRSYKLELEEKKILLESNKGLETEIGSLTVLLNSTKMDLENLTESFHALKQEFFAQQTTIETLLSQEKEKELVYLNKEKEYAETVLKHDHLKEKLIRFESRYWTTQTELTRCISSNPFYHGSKNGTVLAAGPNVGLNNTVASYWKEQIFKQSQLVTECMKRVSNSTKPTEYSLADLEKLVMTSKNYIPVPNEHLFTAKNSLKTCNKVYEKCRVDLNTCQVAYLKEVAGQGKHQLLPSLHSNDILDSRGKTTAKKKPVTHVSTVKPTVKPAPATLTTASAMPAKPSNNPATTTTTTTILPVSAKAKIGAGTNTTPAPVESTTGAGSVDSTTGPAGKSTKYLSFMQA